METTIERQSGYEPPYDSPLEAQLAYFLPKYIEDDARFYKQYQVETPRATYKLDFLVDSSKGKFGFECDGKDYHDFRRDMFRDALILGASDIVSIHRITGADVHNRLDDALFAISKVEPEAFSERGRKNLWTLSTSRSDLEVTDITDSAIAFDPTRFLNMTIGHLSKKSKDPFWKKLFAF
ncbi:MAG TPA: hypothetical protein VF607_17645, partial [Verrucomicrobiae bacterium]